MAQNIVEFKVEVNDVITPQSCSAMIIEFIKYVAYQKQLIPYPYERLKMYVNGRQKQLSVSPSAQSHENVGPSGRIGGGGGCRSKESLASLKYFKTTVAAHDSLENMFKVISDELTNDTDYDRVEEVVLLLGTSVTNPQDIYRLCIPRLNYAHSVKYHSTHKSWRNLFRTMINSDKFNDILCSNSCTGRMHILLKMKLSECVTANAHLFIPRAEFKLPTRGNHAVITFKGTENKGDHDCLCQRPFNIFEDDLERSPSTSDGAADEQRCRQLPLPASSCSSPCPSPRSSSSSNATVLSVASRDLGGWFQIKDTLKYFADVTVNNVSLTDLWMNPKIALQ